VKTSRVVFELAFDVPNPITLRQLSISATLFFILGGLAIRTFTISRVLGTPFQVTQTDRTLSFFFFLGGEASLLTALPLSFVPAKA